MAGLYPDAPAGKLMYDRDGSTGAYIKVTGVGSPSTTTASGANLISLNGESRTTVFSRPTGDGDIVQSAVGILFPELRDVVGYFYDVTFAGNTTGQGVALQTSVDTTNFTDGTWVTRTAPTVATNFRTGVQAVSFTGIKAIKFLATHGQSFPSTNFNGIHLYGSAASGQAPDRLRIWHPTLNQELGGAGLDFSDLARTYTADKTFRIKNNSATLTANSIVLSNDALTDTSPTVVGQLSISQGAGFAATQNIGALTAGSISGVCTQRVTLVSNATLSIWRQRLIASAGSWT